VRFVEDKMVEDWVADSVVRLSVDGPANLLCSERAMRTGLTRVTTDDVKTTRKVIGREREEEDDDEEKKRQKRGEEVGEEVEEKIGREIRKKYRRRKQRKAVTRISPFQRTCCGTGFLDCAALWQCGFATQGRRDH
jgi:hypothetical protein